MQQTETLTQPGWRLPPRTATIISLLVTGGSVLLALFFFVVLADMKLVAFLLAGVVGLVGATLVILRPEWGSYLLVGSIVTNISFALTNQGLPAINKPLMALVVGSIVLNQLFNPAAPKLLNKRFGLVELLLILYGGSLLLSTFASQDVSASLNQIEDYAKDIIILLCIVVTLNTREQVKTAVWLIITAATGIATLGFYQVVTGNYSQQFFNLALVVQEQVLDGVEQARLAGPIGDPNFYGQILVAILPLAIYRLLYEKAWWLKAISLFSIFLLAFNILNTYSRGAFLAMVVVVLVIAIQQRIRFGVLALIGLFAGALMLFALPESYTERIGSLLLLTQDDAVGVQQESSFRGRTSEYLAGLMMFADQPLIGVGPGNYRYHYQDYASRIGLETRTEDREAHSLYLEVAAETGIVGLVTFGVLLLGVLWELSNARRTLPMTDEWQNWLVALSICLGAYLVSSIFLHGSFSRYLWLFVAIALSAARLHLQSRKVTA